MRSISGWRARRVAVAVSLIALTLSWEAARGASGAVPRRQMQESIFYRVRTSQRAVALTFDDGPIPGHTERILDLLRAEGMHATFFVVGKRAFARPDLVRAITTGGNEIGNHTWSHQHLTWVLDDVQRDEIARGARELEQFGVHPIWFRPPYGLISRLGVKDVTAAGERTVLWSVSIDRALSRWGDRAVSELLSRVHPGDIILAHDARPGSFDALQRLLAGLKRKGLRCGTVSELVAGSRV